MPTIPKFKPGDTVSWWGSWSGLLYTGTVIEPIQTAYGQEYRVEDRYGKRIILQECNLGKVD